GSPGRTPRRSRAPASAPSGSSRSGTRGSRRGRSARSRRARRARSRRRRSRPELRPVLALVVLAVLARPDRFPPVAVVAVPGDRSLDPLVEVDASPPPEALGPIGRERVAAVVPEPVADVVDQRFVP